MKKLAEILKVPLQQIMQLYKPKNYQDLGEMTKMLKEVEIYNSLEEILWKKGSQHIFVYTIEKEQSKEI